MSSHVTSLHYWCALVARDSCTKSQHFFSFIFQFLIILSLPHNLLLNCKHNLLRYATIPTLLDFGANSLIPPLVLAASEEFSYNRHHAWLCTLLY